MKLNELKPAEGSRSKRLRKGRGLSSGHGFTRTWYEGQKALVRLVWLTGQMPLTGNPKAWFHQITTRNTYC